MSATEYASIVAELRRKQWPVYSMALESPRNSAIFFGIPPIVLIPTGRVEHWFFRYVKKNRWCVTLSGRSFAYLRNTCKKLIPSIGPSVIVNTLGKWVFVFGIFTLINDWQSLMASTIKNVISSVLHAPNTPTIKITLANRNYLLSASFIKRSISSFVNTFDFFAWYPEAFLFKNAIRFVNLLISTFLFR